MSSEHPTDGAAEARRRAVASLEAETGADRGARLFEALGDVDWRVRKEAVRVADSVAESWGIADELVSALSNGENVGLRNAALEVLERLGPRAAEPLLRALPEVPATARKFLVAALGFAGPSGVDRLAELSNDADENTAQAALESLARVGGTRAEEALRAHLASADPVQRLAAIEGLERLEASVSLEALRPSLEDRLVRRVALRLLGHSEAPDAVATLFEGLSDPGAAVTAEATVALGRILSRGGAAAEQAARMAETLDAATRKTLRSFASVGRDRPRRAATWLLLIAKDEEVLGVAAELAADDRLPLTAIASLRDWGVDAIAPLLRAAEGLGAAAQTTAFEMAAELAAAGAPSDEQLAALRASLRGALAGEDAQVAAGAAAAIERFAEAADAARLVDAAKRFGERVARPAGRSLVRLVGQARTDVEAALVGAPMDGAVGAALLPAVAALGGATANDTLQAALSADDPRARRAAVLSLGELELDVAIDLSAFALADEDLDVQTAAVSTLAHLAEGARGGDGDVRGVQHLRLALRAEVEPVAAGAARALGGLGDSGSIAALRDLVAAGRPGVAVAAMEALRQLDDPSLDTLLVEALGQSDPELVKEALRAIAERPGDRRASRMVLALEHEAWDVRELAARLLGQLGGAAARQALEHGRERETDASVRAVIEEALDAAGGSD